MLAQSHLSDRLEAMAKQLGMDLCVYIWGPTTHPAYAQTRYRYIMRGFKGSMSQLQHIFSQRMFGKIRLKHIIRPNSELMENDKMIICEGEGPSGCKKYLALQCSV